VIKKAGMLFLAMSLAVVSLSSPIYSQKDSAYQYATEGIVYENVPLDNKVSIDKSNLT